MFLPARPLPFVGTASDQTLLTGAAVLVGWSLTETSGGAAATVDIYDGTSASGIQIAEVTLSSGQSTRDLWSPGGIEIRQSLAVNVPTGAAKGTLFAVPAEQWNAFMVEFGLRPEWSGGG